MFMPVVLRVQELARAVTNHPAKMNGQLEFVASHGPNVLIAITENICQLQTM